MDENDLLTWQHGSSVTMAGQRSALFKRQSTTCCFGLDTAGRMPCLRPLLFQVGYLNNASCIRSSNRCFLAVSCPPELRSVLKRLLSCMYVCGAMRELLLILAGDVESNPGPMNKTEADAFALALTEIRDLKESYEALLSKHATAEIEIKQLKRKVETLERANALRNADGAGVDADALRAMSDKMKAADSKIRNLSTKVISLEEITATRSVTAPSGSVDALHDVTNQLSKITNRCDEAENRLRRSNLLFFGIEDDPNENWAVSEDKIVKFCSDHLGTSISSPQLERVHRLGRFNTDRRRPIIVKFTFFKDKEQILSKSRKLKGTNFYIREDFSMKTRQARQKLLEFAKAQNKRFKLSVDKLRIDNNTYVFDHSSNIVVLSTR
nr:uncharacterized protein LOC119168726 [Rhipicephalus microplus]